VGCVGTCRNPVRKPKAQLELKLAREVKGGKKGFCKYLASKRESVGSMGPLLGMAVWKKRLKYLVPFLPRILLERLVLRPCRCLSLPAERRSLRALSLLGCTQVHGTSWNVPRGVEGAG